MDNVILLAFVINREEGFLGLWKGVTPNVGRNAIINAAELASYDTVNIPTGRSAPHCLYVAGYLAIGKKY